ncbi:MAG: hypothetical protein ABJL67_15010 [Sulfitobacter sp.]
MTSQSLDHIRMVSLALTGCVCLTYAVLVLATGQPDPMPVWIPGVAGLLALVTIWTSVAVSDTKSIEASFDEGFRADDGKAQKLGFWVAVWLYPVFGVPLYLEWITGFSAIAAMGTLTAAAYLLGTVVFDLRGR